ncbi:MAG TPA: DUF3500 domain-containing protein [Dehalococcoidia bacterium]|nr:DUF3500 domain-containing protein [Dehalococcoidia bacterium]
MVASGTYRGFEVRERWRGPESSGIQLLLDREAFFQRALDNAGERASAAFKGITADGRLEDGVFSLHGRGDDMRPAVAAANQFLAALALEQRNAALRPLESDEWRRWSNAIEAPHGASLLTMTDAQRAAALSILEATLSRTGFQSARTVMKLNHSLGELVGNTDLLGEWNYSMHIYGTPSDTQPWGWQIHGHHLIVSCLVIGNQIVLTPTFMGAEPRVVDFGKHAGLTVLEDEQTAGLALINGLTPTQQEKAILFRSIQRADLPPDRVHPADGRHKGGAFQDNLVLPYEGLLASELTAGQTELLLRLFEVYIGRMSSGHASAKMDEIKACLDRTHIVWMGGCDDDSVFYYRLHSPVVLIEFDHHHGVFLSNDEPQQFHTHTIVRTPNGNDYGRDILRQHYAQAHANATT